WRSSGVPACGPVAVTWSVSPGSCPLSWAVSADSPIPAAPSARTVALVITPPATSAPRICQVISLLAVINSRVESWHSAVQERIPAVSDDKEKPAVSDDKERADLKVGDCFAALQERQLHHD